MRAVGRVMAIAGGALFAVACHRRVPVPPLGAAGGSMRGAVAMVSSGPQRPVGATTTTPSLDDEPAPPPNAPFAGDAPPLRRCLGLRGGDPSLGELLDRSERRMDQGDGEGALDCAEEAIRLAPDEAAAEADRAAALALLGRLDDARRAYTLALALAPEDADTLAGAADLYVNRLGPDHDDTEIGLAFARRGEAALAHLAGGRAGARELDGRLALLSAQALDDLGRSDEALPEIATALDDRPGDEDALYEKGVALFDLCRFVPAREAFEAVLAKDPGDAFAHDHLGLVLEQLGDASGAERELGRARELSPKDFPAPLALDAATFDALVQRAVEGLSPDLRESLSQARLELRDLPELADLVAGDPPFPPSILGLFRGPALDETVSGRGMGAPRSILLYRKNLLRAVSSVDELREQIGVTLLHEIGHLRGQDEDELRARGLE